jgi:succinate dehydrogenase / fumarate reductase membrane anchor subunit
VKEEYLGAAGNGFSDWLWQRASAVILVLTLPFPFILVLCLLGGCLDQAGLLSLVAHPFARAVHSLLLLAMFAHAYLGLKLIMEDYVPALTLRLPLLLATLVLVLGTGAWALAMVWGW